MNDRPLDLAGLNAAAPAACVAALEGLYVHSPWVAERAVASRPWRSLPHLRQALRQMVDEAGHAQQLALLRAHPELAGRAQVAQALTADSAHEQGRAGLTACTPVEFERLQGLNAAYGAKFGWPFILAVRGPRGEGLTRTQIIDTFARRLEDLPEAEFQECLRQVHRIAELRLDERFGTAPVLGHQAWDWAEALARHSDPGFAERGQLSVAYLGEAHQACARQLAQWMREDCGFDEVVIDAVGNVVGVYHGTRPEVPRLLSGSHYDTVRDAGRYDGRLGIFVPMLAVRALRRAGRRLPFGIEVVGFAEEEGQRYKAVFLGSSALAGRFEAAWLDQVDAEGVPMREAMRRAGLDARDIPSLARDPARYQGFVEVHIEQGPVLCERGLPLGVVSAINGSVRCLGEVVGQASHAGTTPMDRRRDAAAAVAELVLYLERRAASVPDLVGTVGQLEVPSGSVNVVPGRCRFSLDIRATTDAVRDACLADARRELALICERRGLRHTLEETMRAAAAPSDPAWQARWARAVDSLGLPVHRLPSGAGHDAMKLHEVMPQAMLFVRGENGGISHNPLESTTSHDMDLAVQAFAALLEQRAAELGGEQA